MKYKTPEYTRKAIEKYHSKHDRIMVSLEKGSKEWIKNNTGLSCNAFFKQLFNSFVLKPIERFSLNVKQIR